MRRSMAVLEKSFSVVPGVTTTALLASRTQRGSAFLWGFGDLPGSRGPDGATGGRGEGARSEPGWAGPLALPTEGASRVALAPGALLPASAPGGRASDDPKGLDCGMESKNEDGPPLVLVAEEPEPPVEPASALPAPSPPAPLPPRVRV